MRYNEWTKGKQSIFVELFARMGNPDFADIVPEELESTFTFLYGEKTIPRKMENLSVNEVVTMLYTMYNKEWTSYYNLVYNELMDGVAETNTETNQQKTDSDRKSNRNDTSNVSAFNETEFVPESETVGVNSDKDLTEITGTKTRERKSLWAIQQQLRMVEDSFISKMFKDVNSQITLKIY